MWDQPVSLKRPRWTAPDNAWRAAVRASDLGEWKRFMAVLGRYQLGQRVAPSGGRFFFFFFGICKVADNAFF